MWKLVTFEKTRNEPRGSAGAYFLCAGTVCSCPFFQPYKNSHPLLFGTPPNLSALPAVPSNKSGRGPSDAHAAPSVAGDQGDRQEGMYVSQTACECGNADTVRKARLKIIYLPSSFFASSRANTASIPLSRVVVVV